MTLQSGTPTPGLLAARSNRDLTGSAAEPGQLANRIGIVLSVGLLAIAANAGVAVAAGSSESSETLQEVVVTGSRIATPELESMTPVTLLSNQAIEASGALNISDFLRDLPSVGTSTLSTTNSNFLTNNSGVNSINLRNLGDQRTLVLVNSKRYVPGISGSSVVDFNTIPTDFIEHIEIITGGASAIYG
jgi:outer membrane cobalamin receptor